jgi:hypothetical protein
MMRPAPKGKYEMQLVGFGCQDITTSEISRLQTFTCDQRYHWAIASCQAISCCEKAIMNNGELGKDCGNEPSAAFKRPST